MCLRILYQQPNKSLDDCSQRPSGTHTGEFAEPLIKVSIQQRFEDLLLAREVMVECPSRDSRLVKDLLHGRLTVPLSPEHPLGRFQDPLPRFPRPLLW